ncbi:hypothetical protein AX16_007452 [Volvariella volvacea WC 439]|nr:hypothetical protein AX16_007452 [Volvariella volvacea WC 439]
MATVSIPPSNPQRDGMAGSPMEVTSGTTLPVRYDSAFSSPEADVVLASLEGTLYRVPSFVLRNTCGMFRKLLGPRRHYSHSRQQIQEQESPQAPAQSNGYPRASSPTPSTLSSISSFSGLSSSPVQIPNSTDTDSALHHPVPGAPNPTAVNTAHPTASPALPSPSPAYSFASSSCTINSSSEQSPIIISHSDKILSRVLRLLTGLETEPLQCFDELEEVLALIEQFDAPGPLSVIQGSITSPFFLSDPLRLYGITTRFGWEEEAKLASEKTLALSLFDDENQHLLRRLSTKSLLALLSLHRKRRDEFKNYVDTADSFFVGNGGDESIPCAGCGQMIDNHWWREYKSRMFLEMDKRPLGDKIIGLEGVEEWQEAVNCWNAKCEGGINGGGSGNGNGSRGCGRLYYDKVATLRDIRAILEKLPKTI